MIYAENDQNGTWSAAAAAAQAGDKKAYNALLKEIFVYTRAVLSRSLSGDEAIDDIAQEVLLSVHKSLKTYSPDRPFKPWLHAIIGFRKTDYLRKYYARRQDKAVPLDYADFSASSVTNPAQSGELKDIEAALQSLPEQQRRIFRMIKIEGYSAKDVANEMNMKESAVKVSAHRAAKKLKDMLK